LRPTTDPLRFAPHFASRATTDPLRFAPHFASRPTTGPLRFLPRFASRAIVLVLVLLGGCAQGVPEIPITGPVARLSRAQGDRNDCIAAAQASLASGFTIETRARRITTRPRGRVLATFATDEDRNALLDGLVDHLVAACLTKKGYQEFLGFLFLPPRGEGWSRNVSRRGDNVDVVFTKSTGTPDAPHAALALAGLFEVELRDAAREAGSQKLIAELRDQWSGQRFSRLSVDTTEHTWLGASCIGYRVIAQDRGVPKFEGQAFALGVRGIRCLHPDLATLQPRKVVDLGYSQRFRSGGVWQSAIDPEVEPFLSSLIFVPLDPTTHVIAALQMYATTLRELGRGVGATDVLNQVEALRKSGGATFAVGPAERLQSYAALLRGRGRGEDAAAAEALAAAYLRTGFREHLRQRGT
jgi:hypothetical protein